MPRFLKITDIILALSIVRVTVPFRAILLGDPDLHQEREH